MIAAIGAMQSGKACGLDGTCTELFKDCVRSFAPLMTALFNACLSAGRVSDTMMRGVVTLLFKAGDRRDPSKYRPITLLNKTMSVLAEICKRRWRAHMPDVTLPDQCSSAPGRNMFEALFKALDAIDWAENERYSDNPPTPSPEGQPDPDALAAVLLDMRKAFDLMNRGYLRDILSLVCERGARCDIDAVLNWTDLLLGTVELPHMRAVP